MAASRRIALSILLAANAVRDGTAASAAGSSSVPSSPPRKLRGSSQAADSTSSEDVPDVTDARSLQEGDATFAGENATTAEEDAPTAPEDGDDTATVLVPTDCLDLLLSSANEFGKVKKDGYFAFTDSMSNGWYTANDMTSYSDLPPENKYAYVTLTCRCKDHGGRDNCCQGNRAKIDTAGMEDPDEMSPEMRLYVNDICELTDEAIGENRLSVAPTSSPATSAPTIAPTDSVSPTRSPSTSSPTDLVTVVLPEGCLNLLAATANENDKIGEENYFVFTDGMSNGYYTVNNMTSFSDLPEENKFAWVTLTCRCSTEFGGRNNCCQGNRAKLDVSGIDDPESMSVQMQLFVNDICETTSAAVGNNTLDPSGELPTTARPTTAPTARPTTTAPTTAPTSSPSKAPTTAPSGGPSGSPTSSPTSSPTRGPTRAPTSSPSRGPTQSPTLPAVIAPVETPDGNDGSDGLPGGLGPGAWAGIGIAAAVVGTLVFYLCVAFVCKYPGKGGKDDDDTLGEMDGRMDGKGGAAAAAGTELVVHTGKALVPSSDSPDTIVTASDDNGAVSGVGNANRSGPYGKDLMLPEIPDGEGALVSSDEDAGALADPGAIEEGAAVRGPRKMTSNSTATTVQVSNEAVERQSSLGRAVETGKWEEVATKSAAIAKQSESKLTSAVPDID